MFFGGQEAQFAFGMGTQILPHPGVEIYGRLTPRMALDEAAEWFEIGFQIDHALSGNAAAGYTDAGNYFRIEIEQSYDLATWNMGKFVPAPVPVVDLGGGSYQYWARSTVPRLWKFVTIDVTATSTRYGKEITGIELFGDAVALRGFPYAIPADAARLQADLIAAGFAGATVATEPAALSVVAHNYQPTARERLIVTMSGNDVTLVEDGWGTSIPLLGYPYAMPSQRATLQDDLRAAGFAGAVVELHGDAWTITLPDLDTILGDRAFTVFFTPGDPFPTWDFFGNYTGLNPNDRVAGGFDNVRATSGLAPLVEAEKQFARLKITSGSRYHHLTP